MIYDQLSRLKSKHPPLNTGLEKIYRLVRRLTGSHSLKKDGQSSDIRDTDEMCRSLESVVTLTSGLRLIRGPIPKRVNFVGFCTIHVVLT